MKTMMLVGLTLALLPLGWSGASAQPDQPPPGGHGGAVRAACQADLDKYCADIQGHGRFECLRQHQDQLSDGCKGALAEAHSWHYDHPGAGPMPSN